jgi:hypothetical protein
MGRQTHCLNSRHTYTHNLVADSNPWLPRERQEVICPNNPMTPAFFLSETMGKHPILDVLQVGRYSMGATLDES